jgi:ABC-2 type transport system ATP-binding protein
MPAIEVHALAKTYSGAFGRAGQPALRGVDLTIERGIAFGLIGLNGAGKTTFIKALLGIVRPSSGTVKILGGDPEDPSVRARVGYLPERLHLPNASTPIEFLASVARLKRLRDRDDDARRQLARVGLEGDSGRKIGGFSKGMRQRVGLAAALLGQPELLILDEPTDGVDPLGRTDVRRILGEEKARGTTVFLNSHLLSETERVCDRVGILAKGLLAREGELEVLCRSTTRHRARFAPGSDSNRLQNAGFSTSDAPDVFFCDAADAEALAVKLDAARAAGALLVELGAELKDLEDVLAEANRAA